MRFRPLPARAGAEIGCQWRQRGSGEAGGAAAGWHEVQPSDMVGGECRPPSARPRPAGRSCPAAGRGSRGKQRPSSLATVCVPRRACAGLPTAKASLSSQPPEMSIGATGASGASDVVPEGSWLVSNELRSLPSVREEGTGEAGEAFSWRGGKRPRILADRRPENASHTPIAGLPTDGLS